MRESNIGTAILLTNGGNVVAMAYTTPVQIGKPENVAKLAVRAKDSRVAKLAETDAAYGLVLVYEPLLDKESVDEGLARITETVTRFVMSVGSRDPKGFATWKSGELANAEGAKVLLCEGMAKLSADVQEAAAVLEP